MEPAAERAKTSTDWLESTEHNSKSGAALDGYYRTRLHLQAEMALDDCYRNPRRHRRPQDSRNSLVRRTNKRNLLDSCLG